MKPYRNTLFRTLLLVLSLFIIGTYSCGADDEPEGTVSGSVKSSSGENLEDVNIVFRDVEDANNTRSDRSSNGRYQIGGMRLSTYSVTATKTGFVDFEFNGNFSLTVNNPERTLNIEMVPLGSLNGTITDALTNDPIPGVAIQLTGTENRSANTNLSGFYNIDQLKAGDYQISLIANGYERKTQDVRISDGVALPLNLSLTPLPYITGVVVDKKTNLPLNGVRAELSGTSTGALLTNAQGKFTFTNLNNGQYKVTLSKDDFHTSETNLTIEDGNPIDRIFQLEAIRTSAAISGVVKDENTDLAIPNAKVSISGTAARDLETDETGAFIFSELDAGPYEFKVEAAGYVAHSETIQLGQTEERNMVITLTPLPYISGTILSKEDNTPIQGAKIALSGSVTVDQLSDDDGKFRFENLNEGAYDIGISKEGYKTIEETLNLSINEPIEKVYSLELAPTLAAVHGKVINNETTQGIAQVTLSLTGQTTGDTFSNDNGNYRFENLEPGNYTITATKQGFMSKEVSLQLAAGDDTESIIQLEPVNAELKVTPTTLDFLENKTTLPIEISNSGEGELQWEIVEDITWLTVSDLEGTVTGSERKTITISVDRETLGQGSHSNVFTVKSNGGSEVVTARLTVQPELCVTPKDLDFGTSTEAKSVSVENCGTGTIDYSIVPDSEWIKVSTTSGTVTHEKDPISISVDHSGLSPGNYTGQVIFNSNSGSTEVVVNMTVPNLNEPQLTISDESLDFGSDQANKVISVSNTGKKTLEWTLSKEQNWITVSKSSGKLEEGESEDVDVQVFRSGLAPNIYNGSLEFNSNGGQKNVPVKMQVAATPILRQSAQVLDFGYDQTQLSFDITNIGNATLQWELSSDVNWITLVPTSGTDAATVTVFVDRNKVSDGSYNGTITINSNGGVGALAVNMVKAPSPPNLILESYKLKSDANESGTPNPGESVTYTIQLKNDNGASEGTDIKATFSSPGPFVNSFEPQELAFGTIPINESVEMDVTINFSSLAEVGTVVPINLTIKDTYGQSWAQSFTVEMKSFFIVPQGLLAYYRFDEGDFRDETGNHNGLGFGPEHTSDTPDGQGLSIEFKAEEKDFFQTAKNIIGWKKEGTFNFWMKTTGNRMRLFTSSLRQTYERSFIYIDPENRIWANADRNYYYTRFTTDVSSFLLDGTWHMLTISIKKYQHRMYIDGELIEQDTPNRDLAYTSNSEGFAFGKRSGEDDLFFNGKMDNIRIYDRALSEEEVKLLYEKKQ